MAWKKPKNFVLILIIFSFFTSCSSIKPSIENGERDIQENIRIVKIDPLNQVYVLNKRNKLTQYNSTLAKKYEYADNTLGNITHLDVSNPLKILIFKKDYGTIIQLDNTLSEIDRLNLFSLGFQGISAIATALDGNIWIYDSSDYQIKKVNASGHILLTSINMVDIGLSGLEPNFIVEKNGKIILKDPDVGILLFDNLGQYIQTFPFLLNYDPQFDGENISYYKNGKINKYNIRFFEESEIVISPKSSDAILNVILNKNYQYHIYSNGLDVVKN